MTMFFTSLRQIAWLRIRNLDQFVVSGVAALNFWTKRWRQRESTWTCRVYGHKYVDASVQTPTLTYHHSVADVWNSYLISSVFGLHHLLQQLNAPLCSSVSLTVSVQVVCFVSGDFLQSSLWKRRHESREEQLIIVWRFITSRDTVVTWFDTLL